MRLIIFFALINFTSKAQTTLYFPDTLELNHEDSLYLSANKIQFTHSENLDSILTNNQKLHDLGDIAAVMPTHLSQQLTGQITITMDNLITDMKQPPAIGNTILLISFIEGRVAELKFHSWWLVGSDGHESLIIVEEVNHKGKRKQVKKIRGRIGY